MKLSETNSAQYWVLLGSDPSQAFLSQARSEEDWVMSSSMALAALMPFQISRIVPCPVFVILSSFKWLHQWGFHLWDLSHFFKFINVLPNFSHALILSWIMWWFQKFRGSFSGVGTSVTTSKYAVIYYWLLTFLRDSFHPYTLLIVHVSCDFGILCLFIVLAWRVYSTASSDTVRFGLLQCLGLFKFPLAPSHPVDWLSFVKCFTDVALYLAPSFSLALIWFSVAQLHSSGYGVKTVSASTSQGQWWNLLINFKLKRVKCLCKAVTMWCAEVSFEPMCYTSRSFTLLYFHTNTLCETWELVLGSLSSKYRQWRKVDRFFVHYCKAL